MNKYINDELCASCGGECCKAMGCHFSPNDFEELSYENLKKEIEKGLISIDWWEGNPFEDGRNISKAYYLRMRNKNAKIVDASWGGECILLEKDGCPLKFEERPLGARALVPRQGGCIIEYSKQQCAKDWYKYDDILAALVDFFK